MSFLQVENEVARTKTGIALDGLSNADIKKFTTELEKQIGTLSGDVATRMDEALDIVEETAQRLVPEDTQATRNSFFRRVEKGEGYVKGIAGYNEDGSLDYVGIIHENPNGRIQQWQKAGAEDRFLAKAFERNIDVIKKTLEG